MKFNSRTHASRIRTQSAEDFFHEALASALRNQGTNAETETVFYLVNLLSAFIRAENLFERTPEGVTLRPLAEIYADATQAPTAEARNQALRRLGDVALFIAGLFPDSLSRKPVDVDYYVAMGGTAYGFLSEVLRERPRGRTYAEIFSELSAKFQDFVDVIAEVGEHAHVGSDTDMLRLYELWTRTGSRRAARKLVERGIHPMNPGKRRH